MECLSLVVNNYRFLILPWIRIKNLASFLLSQTLRRLRTDWYGRYGVMPILAETFVDHERYLGTCYLAANWKYLGETKGYGKSGNLFVYHGNRKGVYLYEIDKKEMKAIRKSCHQTLKTVRRREPYMMLQKPDWNPGILTDAGITEEMVRNLGNELDDFLLCFDTCFRYEQGMYAATYLKGLMSDLEYKSAEPIALRYGLEPRNMQRFLRDGKWDEAQMGDTYRHLLSGAIAHPDAMITVDGCDIPKKGYNSVGVARQYCGATGKIDNCQAGVYVGYSGPNGYALIDRRLYLPEKWFEDSHRSLWEECGIPDSTVFTIHLEQTKKLMNLIKSYQKEAVFHRAFDCVPDAGTAVEQLITTGVDRILTSGQKEKALDGAELIADLQKNYGTQIEILAGSGINHNNAAELLKKTGIHQIHSSCKTWLPDPTTTGKNITYAYAFADSVNDNINRYEVVSADLVKKLIGSIKAPSR